jgi:hypothetical protein
VASSYNQTYRDFRRWRPALTDSRGYISRFLGYRRGSI